MKILVTGATGFISSHVTRELVRQGHTVFALGRNRNQATRLTDIAGSIQFIEADFLCADWDTLLSKIQPDACIHSAWFMEPGKTFTSPQNLKFVQASLDFALALEKAGCKKLLITGTCFEYDTSIGQLSETSPLKPATLYGAAKVGLYVMLERLSHQSDFNMKLIWPRLFYLYGPAEDEKRLIAHVIKSLLRGEPAKLTGGEQIRDYLHIEDAANALTALVESDFTGAINVASGQPIAIRDLILTAGQILKRTELLKLGALPYRADEPKTVYADTTLLREKLKWKPRFDLQTGLKHTIDWFAHSSTIKP